MATRIPIAVLLLASCAANAPALTVAPTTRPDKPVASAPARAPDAAANPQCAPIRGAADVIARAGILILGEIHGTNEVPDFVGDLACAASRARPTSVLLELSPALQPALDALAKSRGANASGLLAAPEWQTKDGRTSQAMLRLVTRLATLGTPTVRVRAIDGDGSTPNRDRAMAANILREQQERPDAFILVLLGNLHARGTRGVTWNPNLEPAGWIVKVAAPETLTLDVRHAGGEAWVCTTRPTWSCAPTPLKAHGAVSRRWEIVLEAVDGFDGFYEIGPVTASPPAR